MTNITCFVCGHITLGERCDWEICPVCFWEDDVLVSSQDESSSANSGMKVSEAQANYILYRACDESSKEHVRPPKENEPLDPAWMPLKEALALVEQRKQEVK